MHTAILIKQGVKIPQPETVWIAADVPVGAIAPGVVLCPGVRIEGAQTSIGPCSVIGSEGPAVVMNCQLGAKVSLGSGFFEGSVFLDGATMGGGAHVRPGCLIEEQAGGAHTVGLKQTVLLSYVTLGSLINFCDILMAGGTSRKNHSEVGSSYIHFNYTPRQDKATASLIGDAAQGVLLDQSPIFLGGQGGLVGPTRLAYGTIIPAGLVMRKDALVPGQLVVPHGPAAATMSFDASAYGKIDRLVVNNLAYIGNIKAMRAWYRVVRANTMKGDAWSRSAHEGALRVLAMILDERIKRLGEVAARMTTSVERLVLTSADAQAEAIRQQRALAARWPTMLEVLKRDDPDPAGLPRPPDGVAHTEWVAGLDEATRVAVRAALNTLVQQTINLWTEG